MKVEQIAGSIESTMQGEKVMMGISLEDMPHIMGILAGLYKDRLLAMIREYSCNAWDAHVDAGFAGPIEVSLPSNLYPTLKIRDYGTGLSADDIRKVYSQYGRSTKRETNDQVGMMGLGSKSALSYTQQFTVMSVKDGLRITVLIALDEDGVGTMQILDPGSPTDDASGTEVQIAIQREDIWVSGQRAAEFFKYWAPGSVTVDGKPPARFEGLKLSDNLYLVEAASSESRIVMGNVAYPHDIDVYNGKRTYRDPSIALIAFVPIGSVKPTPSRESLMDVRITKDTVTRIRADYRNGIGGVIQREVDACDTHSEAIQKISKWSKFLPKESGARTYTFKGIDVPEHFCLPLDSEGNQPSLEITQYGGYAAKADVSRQQRLDLGFWPTTVWVENFLPGNFTAPHKSKLLEWCRTSGLIFGDVRRFVLLREQGAPDTPFIEKKMIVPWETIRQIKLETQSSVHNGVYRIPGSYNFYTEAGYQEGKPGADIRQDELIVWKQGNLDSCESTACALEVLYPKFTLLCLGENRVAKFCRDVPAAKPWKQAVEDGYKAWMAKLSDLDKQVLAQHDRGIRNQYEALGRHSAPIDDPRIVAAIKIAQHPLMSLLNTREKLRYLIDVSGSTDKADHPLVDYPLAHADRYGRINLDNRDIPFYLNAKYARLTKAKPVV